MSQVPSKSARPVRGWLAASAVVTGALVLALVASWPLAHWSGAVFASHGTMPDLNVALWLPWHLSERLAALGSPYEAPLLQHPHGQRISLFVWNLGIQVLQLPFVLIFGPLQGYNLSLVAFGAGNALGGYILGRSIAPGDRSPAVVAAAVLGTSPYAWNELVQGRVEQGFVGLCALVVAGLVALHRAPSRRVALLTGLAWGLAGLCYWFYGYFLALWLGVLLVLRAGQRRWELVQELLVAGAAAAVVAAPAALVLLGEALGQDSVYQQATAGEAGVQQRVGTIVSMGSLSLAHTPLWWASPPQLLRDVVPVGGLGLVVLGALWARREARWLAPMAGLGLVLALGPVLQWTPGQPLGLGAEGRQLILPMKVLQDVVPGFSRLWWPYRFQLFVALGAAGCGATVVARVLRRRLRWGLAVALLLLSLMELRVAQQRTRGGLLWDAPEAVPHSDFFERLGRSETVQPLLFLPFQGQSSGRVYWQTVHQQPMSIGLGDSDAMLLPAGVQAAIDEDPVLTWLQAAGRRESVGDCPLQGRALADHLRGLGFRWVVLWDSPPQPGDRKRYGDVLGRHPDVKDGVVVAWEL